MYHHYLTQTERLFPDFVPEPEHPQTYEDIRDMILQRAAQRPVFFKDMAYYVADRLPQDPAFVTAMTHAFLVRDPAESVLSYARRDPDVTRAEIGIEAQYQLFTALTERGVSPVVITADQLRKDTQGALKRYWTAIGLPFVADAFSWDDHVPEAWQSVAGWHKDVLGSGAIRTDVNERDHAAELAQLGAPFTEYERHHRPFYDALQHVAQQQTHQK